MSSAGESSANFVVTVVPTSGTVAASGSVRVQAGSVTVCTTTLDSGGVGRCTLTPGQLKVGTHRMTAVFAGTVSLKASKSSGTTLVVTK